MEVNIRLAKAKLSELIAAVERGERVVITRNGQPAAELNPYRAQGGIDFAKLQAARKRLGLESVDQSWPEAFNDPELSRRVLGL
jgi:prevent-host-death family protein